MKPPQKEIAYWKSLEFLPEEKTEHRHRWCFAIAHHLVSTTALDFGEIEEPDITEEECVMRLDMLFPEVAKKVKIEGTGIFSKEDIVKIMNWKRKGKKVFAL